MVQSLDHARGMSNSSESPGVARPLIRVSSTSALVASVPFLVGFTPSDSMVLVFLSATSHQVVVTLRVDLPPSHDLSAEQHTVAMIAETVERALRHEIELDMGHIVLWHDDASLRDRRRLLATLSTSLQDLGVIIGHWLATDGRAMWDYAPDHSTCCDGPGHELSDPESTHTRFAMVVAGLGFAGSRGVLAESVAPGDQQLSPASLSDATAMRNAAECEGFGATWRREVEDAIVLASQRAFDDAELAAVGAIWVVALADARVREPVMYRLLRLAPADRVERLSRCREWLPALVAITPEAHCPPVAATLAAIAWQQGDGAFATIAADRALAINPEHSLATIVKKSACSGLPPQQWVEILVSIGLSQLRGVTVRMPPAASGKSANLRPGRKPADRSDRQRSTW